MVFAVYVYVLIATWIAFRLGQPLIRLNFLNEKLTANFRYALMRLRENAENIAFYQGAQVERGTLLGRFFALIGNAWALVFRNLKFSGFNLGISQVAVVFPFILQAPRFFSGAIKLGDVMQTAQAFGQVQDSLSFFRESYDTFASYRATLDRLTGFLDANQQASALPKVDTDGLPKALAITGLQVLRPDGHALIANLDLHLQAGQALLIKGPSGSGKTTLLRALAGLWPYAEGEVRRPLGHQALFLSQRPYLPLGDLRTAIAYPADGRPEDDARMQQALRQVNLAHLAERLDVQCDWSRILSVGEQQRLAFARVLFNQPQVVFLDESTSAMDEGLEHGLYALLRSEMPETLLVSVGHRSTLAAFHTHRLEVDGQGGGPCSSSSRWSRSRLRSAALNAFRPLLQRTCKFIVGGGSSAAAPSSPFRAGSGTSIHPPRCLTQKPHPPGTSPDTPTNPTSLRPAHWPPAAPPRSSG